MPISCYCCFLISSAICVLLVFDSRNPVADAGRLMKNIWELNLINLICSVNREENVYYPIF